MNEACFTGQKGLAGPNTTWRTCNWRAALLAVFLVAIAARIVSVREIRDIGFFHVPLSDALVYVERAAGILVGDWLGPADFIHAPLYAYMLAAVRAVGFDSLVAPRMMQALLGAMSCVLLMAMSRRALSQVRGCEAIAIATGLIFALYPPAIFYDGLIQKTSTVVFLSTLLLWLLLNARDQQSRRWWLASGAALGLLILVRQNALALLPLLGAFAWFGVAMPRRHKTMNIGAIVIGLAIVLAPWVVRHKIVLGEFFISTPNMGQNFAMGNHPEATGSYLPAQRGRASGESEHAVWKRAAEEALGRELTAAEISDYYMDASLAYIKANPVQWLGMTGKKVIMVFGAYELPDTEDYYLYKEHSRLLRIGDNLLHFGVLGPLAIGGIVLTWRHWRRLWILHGWLTINALAIAAFVVFGRYRAPMLPVMTMFAAIALVHGVILLRGRQWGNLALPACAVMIAAAVMNWPIHSHRVPQAFSYVNHAVALAEAGRHDEALRELDRAHEMEPADVDAHWIRASVLFDMQRYDEAIAHYHAALTGDPSFGGAHRGIGSVLLARGEVAEAAAHFQAALELDIRDSIAMSKLAVTHAMQDRPLHALALLERAAALDPTDAEVRLNLGNVFIALRQFDKAVAEYEQALALRPRYLEAHLNLASLHAATDNIDEAIEHSGIALELRPEDRVVLLTLTELFMRAGRGDEAIDLLRQRIEADEEDLKPLFDALRAERDQL